MLPFVFRFRLLFVLVIGTLSAQAQYTRVEDTITRAGHKIVMHKTGFPAQLYTRSATGSDSGPITTEPIHFHVSNSATHKDIQFTSQSVSYEQAKGRDGLQWHAVNTSPILAMKVDGSLQKGNVLQFVVTFTAQQAISLDDIKLHLPLTIEKAHTIEGLGKTASLADTVQWKWSTAIRQADGATISVAGGQLQLMLRDEHFRKNAHPASWANGDKGGIWIGVKGKSLLEEAYSGKRTLASGESIVYHFSLALVAVDQ